MTGSGSGSGEVDADEKFASSCSGTGAGSGSIDFFRGCSGDGSLDAPDGGLDFSCSDSDSELDELELELELELDELELEEELEDAERLDFTGVTIFAFRWIIFNITSFIKFTE